jgi:hypothetical protein
MSGMQASTFQMTTRGIFISMFWGGLCLTLAMHGIRSGVDLVLIVPALFLCECMAFGAPFGAARRCGVAGVLTLLVVVGMLVVLAIVVSLMSTLARAPL